MREAVDSIRLLGVECTLTRSPLSLLMAVRSSSAGGKGASERRCAVAKTATTRERTTRRRGVGQVKRVSLNCAIIPASGDTFE